MNTITQSPHATAGFSFGPLVVFVTSSPVQEGDKAPVSITRKHPQSAFFHQTVFPVRVARLFAHSHSRDANNRAANLIPITRHVFSLRSLPSQLLAEHVGPGGILPRCFPGPFPRLVSTGQYLPGEVSKNFPIRIQVSGRRTAIRVGRFTQVQPKSISDYLRFLSWLVALVDLLGNHTRGVTQSVGAIDRKRGIFTQDKNTGAGGVRRRQSRNLARPGDWLQGR